MLYKNTVLNFRKAELIIALFLLLFSCLLAQAIVVENELRGKFAGNFVDFLAPYIGLFGLWIFLFIIASISMIILLDKGTQEIASIILGFIKSKLIKNTVPKEENIAF